MNIPYPQFVATLVKPGAAILATLDADKVNLWHAATGISGEGTELLAATQAGDDFENMVEELGDLEFYMQQLRGSLPGLLVELAPVDYDGGLAAAGVAAAVEAGNVLDLVKKAAIYNKPLDLVLLGRTLGLLEAALQAVRFEIGVTREDTIEANQRKLAVRYEGLVYSDAAAQARADKAA